MLQFDWTVITRNFPWFWEGMQLTLELTMLAIFGGVLLGTILASMQTSGIKPLRLFAKCYINLFRSIPLILAVFWFYFMVPLVTGRPVGAFYSVLIAFVFFEAAYFAEIIRSGIQSVCQGQISAALATGLSRVQVMRYIVLPQAFRNALPMLMTRGVIIFQDTSLAFVVGLTDFLTAGSIIANREGRPIEVYVFIAVVYLCICSIAELAVQRSRKVSIR